MISPFRAAVVEPGGQGRAIEMQGEEILEIVVGEKEIRNAGGFSRIVICTVLVIPMIEVEVSPDLDGTFFVLLSRPVVKIFDLPETAGFRDHAFRNDELQSRFECVGRQFLIVEKAL